MITAQEAGQTALSARRSFVHHVTAVLSNAIQTAAQRGEQSCSVTLRSLGMPEFAAKSAESLLTSHGYKASHRINSDGSITMGISWLPSMEEVAPELFKLSKGE